MDPKDSQVTLWQHILNLFDHGNGYQLQAIANWLLAKKISFDVACAAFQDAGFDVKPRRVGKLQRLAVTYGPPQYEKHLEMRGDLTPKQIAKLGKKFCVYSVDISWQ